MKKFVVTFSLLACFGSFIPTALGLTCPPTAEEIKTYKRLNELLHSSGLETAKQKIVMDTIARKMRQCEEQLAAERELERLKDLEREKALEDWQKKLDEWKAEDEAKRAEVDGVEVILTDQIDPSVLNEVLEESDDDEFVEEDVIEEIEEEEDDDEIVPVVGESDSDSATGEIRGAGLTTAAIKTASDSSKKGNWLKNNIFDIGKIGIPVLSLFIGYFITRKKKKKFTKYLRMAQKISKQYRYDPKRLEAEFYRLKDILNEELHKGKIDEAAYAIVEKRIDEYRHQAKKADLSDQFAELPDNLRDTLVNILSSGESARQDLVKAYAAIDQSGLDQNAKDNCKDMVCHLHEKPKAA